MTIVHVAEMRVHVVNEGVVGERGVEEGIVGVVAIHLRGGRLDGHVLLQVVRGLLGEIVVVDLGHCNGIGDIRDVFLVQWVYV